MKRIAVYYNATTRHSYGGEMRDDVTLFRDLLTPEMPDAEFVMIDAANGEFPDDPSVFDGVIMGGSAAMIEDREPWMNTVFNHIRRLDMTRTKLWGICFGHQAIAHVFGGQIVDAPVSLGAPDLEILEPQKWMHPYMPSLHLYAGNFQQVKTIPNSMRRIAMGRGNPNAMLAKDDHIVSLQFHPEFSHGFMEGYANACLSGGAITSAEHQSATKEFAKGNDAKIVAKWMAHFFAD